MIRTEREYAETQRRLQELRAAINAQETTLRERGLSPDDIELAMDHLYSFKAQMEDEARAYEHARNREFLPVHRLDQVGDLLIALRIGSGLSQRDLAARLDVPESQVSRDENNEYHNVKVERAQKVLEVLLDELDMDLIICVEPRTRSDSYLLGDEGFTSVAQTVSTPPVLRSRESVLVFNQLGTPEPIAFRDEPHQIQVGVHFMPPSSAGRTVVQGMRYPELTGQPPQSVVAV